MQLRTLGDWCALLDALKERGATNVKIACDPGTDHSMVIGLEYSARPLVEAPPAPQRRTQEDTEKPERKPRPAGQGYL